MQVGPRGFDIANFFLECCFVEESESWDWDLAPSAAEKLAFATAYVDELHLLRDAADLAALDNATTSPTNVVTTPAELVVECDAGWPLVAHLWNILWATTTACAEAAAASGRESASGDAGAAIAATGAVGDGFDYMAYAEERWGRYLVEKHRLQS